MLTKTCPVCNKEYDVQPSQVKRRVCCSRDCANILRAKRTGELAGNWRGGPIFTKCIQCGAQFTVKRSESSKGKFCSQSCKAAWQVMNLRGANNPSWHGGVVAFICETCGKEFYDIPSRAFGRHHMYCSRVCTHLARSKQMKVNQCGPANPMWRGGPKERPSSKKLALYVAQYRANKMNAPINDLTVEQWDTVVEEFNHCCAYCLNPLTRVEQDHMTPLSRGGSHTLSNVVPSCRHCNAKKSDKTLLEFVALGHCKNPRMFPEV